MDFFLFSNFAAKEQRDGNVVLRCDVTPTTGENAGISETMLVSGVIPQPAQGETVSKAAQAKAALAFMRQYPSINDGGKQPSLTVKLSREGNRYVSVGTTTATSDLEKMLAAAEAEEAAEKAADEARLKALQGHVELPKVDADGKPVK